MGIKSAIKSLLRPAKKLIEKGPDDFLKHVRGVIHVGANEGQEREVYNSHDLTVLWIEPIPEVFSRLSANISAYMKQRAIQALVTDTNGKEYEFHVSNNDGQSSSILNLKDHRDIWPSVDFTKTLTLQGSTLPTLLKDQGIDVAQYQALVMDTQGSELLILRGAISILSRFEYIKLEVPDFESYEGCCQLNDVNAFMVSHKYKEHSRKKFASRKEGGSYFDVVFKRQG